MNMPKISIAFGILLIVLGLVAYFGSNIDSGSDSSNAESSSTETTSPDADGETGEPGKKRSAITGLAIPASFGVLLLFAGVMGLKESVRKHAMHGAAMVGTLGALATIGKGSYDLYKLGTGQDVNPRAMTFVWLMAVICAIFVGLCVKSFIDARKRREAEATSTDSSAAS